MAGKGTGRGDDSDSAQRQVGPVHRSRYARLRVSIGRHPSDLIRIVIAAGVVFACRLVARAPGINPVETAIASQLQRLPAPGVWRGLTWIGWWPGLGIAALAALYFGRIRMSISIACSGVAAWILAGIVSWTLAPRPVPMLVGSGVLHEPTVAGYVFPDARTAVIAAVTVVSAPFLGNIARYGGWVLVIVVATGGIVTGGHLPIGVLAGAVLGWGTGTLLHVILGAPGRRTSETAVLLALEQAGITGAHIVAVRRQLLHPTEYDLVSTDGARLEMKIIRRLHRRAGPAHKFRHLLASVEVEEEPRLSTTRHEVEHEAYAALLAERSGVGVVPIVFAGLLDNGPPFLIRRRLEGKLLSELTPGEARDTLLDAIWADVVALGRAHITHHDLRAGNILVDTSGRPRITDFTFSRVGGPSGPRSQDIAELLVSLASVTGTTRAIASLRRALPRTRLQEVIPHLQRLAVHRSLRRQLRPGSVSLTRLRESLAEQIDAPVPSFRLPIRPSTLAVMLAAGLAIYLLLPQLSRLNSVPSLLVNGNRAWLAVTLALGLLAIVASAVSVLGSSPTRLPAGKTIAVQFAAAFTGRTTVAGIGFLGINWVFLERVGFSRTHAVAVITVNRVVMGSVTAGGTILGLAGIGSAVPFSISAVPIGWPVPVIAGAVVAAIAIVASTPFGRRRIVRPLHEELHNGVHELLPVFRRPLTAIQLFGGCIAFLLLSAAGLATALAAFTTSFALIPVLAVFVVGSSLGQLVPSPGGLGAVEAATIAGLTAIGLNASDSVAAVLTSRVLTFWLPVVPGMVVFRVLQRRGVV